MSKNLWKQMRNRCNNPNNYHYGDYGGRGIKVCKEWDESYDQFTSDMGERPSLNHTVERIDVNGGYCPSNCKWLEKGLQNRSTRVSIYLEHNGVNKLLIEWCEEFDMDYNVIKARYNRGDRGEKLFRPIIVYSKAK